MSGASNKKLKTSEGTAAVQIGSRAITVTIPILHRGPTTLDISAPAARPSADVCSRDVANRRDVPIEFESKATIHKAMKHVDLYMLPVRLDFSPDITQAWFERLKERDGKDTSLRDTVRVYCRHLRGYHSAGTSIDTYFSVVLGGELCTEFPDVSFIFGNTRNPVTPLLMPRPTPMAGAGPAVWASDVNSASGDTPVGASLRNYFWLVVLQTWLSANNQFVEQDVYAPHMPRFITPISRTDVRESTEAEIALAEQSAQVPAPSTFAPYQRAFYNSLTAVEKTIFWRSFGLRGKKLAELAISMTLHEFFLAVQCKFFTTFMTAAERDENLKNLYTTMTGHRFRLCEMPGFADRANDAIRMKLEFDQKNKESMKAIRKQQREDVTRRSNENLCINANTTVTLKKMPPNPAIKSTMSYHPFEVQGRIPDIPYFLVHAQFCPIRPVLQLGADPALHIRETLWSIYNYSNIDDRTDLQKLAKARGYAPFTPENEPASVQYAGPHALYLVMRSSGDLPVLHGVHPETFFNTQKKARVPSADAVAVVASTPTRTKAAAQSKAAAAAATTTSVAGKKRRDTVAVASPPIAVSTPRVPDVCSALMTSDRPMPCSPYVSIHSPFVMTADTIAWWHDLAVPEMKFDYSADRVKTMLAKLANGTVKVWSNESVPFLDKYLRSEPMSEAKRWQVLLHTTAATQFSHEPGFDWRQRYVWVPRTLEYLRKLHANDTEIYKQRKVRALVDAGYQAGGADDLVLAELCHAFSLESGLNTYCPDDTKAINRRFDRHFFVADRVLSLLKILGATVEIDGKKADDSVLDELVSATCTAAATDTPLTSALLQNSLAPCRIVCEKASAHAEGVNIPALFVDLWMRSVKSPLLFHAMYISNPPVGPRLASGSEWVRPKCTVVRTDEAEVLLPQITKMKNIAMSQAQAVVTKAQWPKLYMTMNHSLASHSRVDLAVEILLAEANDRELKELEHSNQVDQRVLRQRLNVKSQQRACAMDHIRGMMRLYDISVPELTAATKGAGSGGGGGGAAAAIGWKSQLKRLMSSPALFNPHSILTAFNALMMEIDEADLSRAEDMFAQRMSEIVAEDEKTNVFVFDSFVRTYLSPPQPPALHRPAAAAAAASAPAAAAAAPRYHLVFPDDITDPVLKLCNSIVLHCFKKLQIGFTTAEPLLPAQFPPPPVPASVSPFHPAHSSEQPAAFSAALAGGFPPHGAAAATDCSNHPLLVGGADHTVLVAAAAAAAGVPNDYGADDPTGVHIAAASAAAAPCDSAYGTLPPLFAAHEPNPAHHPSSSSSSLL